MSDPWRIDDLEKRIYELEQERTGLLSMARETVKLSKLHSLNLQQVLAMVGRLELHAGDVNERFDTVEQKHDEHDVLLVSMSKTQLEHGELLREILARLVAKKGE